MREKEDRKNGGKIKDLGRQRSQGPHQTKESK